MFNANCSHSKYQHLRPVFVLVKFSSKLFCVEADSSHEEVVKLLSGKVLDVFWRSNGEGGTLQWSESRGRFSCQTLLKETVGLFCALSSTLENFAAVDGEERRRRLNEKFDPKGGEGG